MVTLKEAIALCNIRENEVVYLKQDDELSMAIPITLSQIRAKYDMKNTMVFNIKPHFCCEDYVGMEFGIKG